VAQTKLSSALSRCETPTIDDMHLARMTLGDRSLEREVLEIFARQTTLMLERIAGAAPASAAAAAHTLKGSARGIGAWRVAAAAERLEEIATSHCDKAALRAAIAELETAGHEARAAIGARLDGAFGEACAGRPRDH
jgi:HPt (histidine-containing phosphotransfer) domain-containing protein